MINKSTLYAVLIALLLLGAVQLFADQPKHFMAEDVFQLEFASDPQVSADGKQIVFVRNFMDIMKDRSRSNLWMMDTDGSDLRPLTSGNENHRSPRWSPDGKKLAYVSNEDRGSQIYLRWMDSGQTAKISNLNFGPGNLSWSPDGKWLAFTMFVPDNSGPRVKMPAKPKGAEWAKPAIYIDDLRYRADGAGYLQQGSRHIFVLPVEGGTPRQLSSGDFNHGGPLNWTADGRSIIFSANRHDNHLLDPRNSEIYEIAVASGDIKALTNRKGPDAGPALSPDGSKIAYLGYDDRFQGYQISHLYVMNRDGSNVRQLAGDLDRSLRSLNWRGDGKGVYFQYSDEGNGKIGYASLNGKTSLVAENIGGTTLGRPYASGSYDVSKNGMIAYTECRPDHPGDVAVVNRKGTARRLTHLNRDLFGHKKLGETKEIWYKSSFDQRDIQAWYVLPPDFDASKKYPLIMEIHGGPFADYGDRFTAEVQLFAAAGYVVLYVNPRGSSSYGAEFGNLIHHNYPGEDYDDLMSGIDAMIDMGFVDEKNLFVTGGSGGGVLTSWIVGKTDRFSAAVVAKPVINWFSFALTSDGYATYYKYWFPGYPWEHHEHYFKRSPISLVGNVTTPTMLLTGEADYRTPISESEQYYQALKLRGIDAAMVRIPNASHGIARRPSNLIAKVAYILDWFERYRTSAEVADRN